MSLPRLRKRKKEDRVIFLIHIGFHHVYLVFNVAFPLTWLAEGLTNSPPSPFP